MYPYRMESSVGDCKKQEEQSFLIRNGHASKIVSPSRRNHSKNEYNGWADDGSFENNSHAKEKAFLNGCFSCVFPGRLYCDEWEQLSDSFIHPLDRQRMAIALFLLLISVSSLSAIELTYEAAISVHVMCNLVFAICFLTMLIVVCTRYCKQRHFLFVRIMTYLSCLTYAALIMPFRLPFAKLPDFFTPGDRLWELFLVILVVYVLIPLPYLLCLFVGLVLPVAYTATLVLQWDAFKPQPDYHTITANLLILAGAGNIIGLVAWCIWNRFTRRLLVHVREYALAGVELEKENEKFDRALAACFPPNVAASLRTDILSGAADLLVKEKLVNYESATMILAELIGLDRILTGTPPRDKGVLVNKLLGKLCELSDAYGCVCINVDSGWTLLFVSGIIQSRSDHARSGLHLAFDMLDFASALSDAAGVSLRLRVSVHSGSISCGLVGKLRMVYDAWSHDLVTLQKMHDSSVVGQVQISRETLAFFGNASDIQLSQEPNVIAAAAIADRFVVRPNRPPRLYGFTDVLSSYPDRHLLAPTQLLIAALDSTTPLNCGQFPLFGQKCIKPSPIQLLTSLVRLPDEDAFALHSIRQLQEDFNSLWTVPTIIPTIIYKDGANSVVVEARGCTKRSLLNPVTLRFRNRVLERDFEESSSTLFTLSLISCLLIHVVSTVFHCLVLPKTILLLTLTLFTFINFLTPLFTIVCHKLGCVAVKIQSSSRLRLSLTIICLLLAYLTSQINVLTCNGGRFEYIFSTKAASSDENMEMIADKHRQCPVSVYISAAALIIICMPMLFTRMLALIKVTFALLVALGFSLVIEFTHQSLFSFSGSRAESAPSDLALLASLAIFVIFVFLHGRLLDRLERITLLWQRVCAERHVETSSMTQHCRRVLNNILPEPALTCLVDSAIPIDSYSENQDNIAVAVISLDNLPQASSLERRLNSTKSLDAFRLLSQLIHQIDELLAEGRFKDLTKVRSVGSQYIVAVGLYATEINPPETVISQRLSVAIDFVLAVRQMIVMTNSSTGCEITVHSGISIGSVTCGVIACRTIFFDIFSNTVRTALQMAKSCKPEYVQVSETVYTYTRYLYRYYSRKRMSVDPIGEFFAYRLIGTRAMYRNGPLGFGPLIGSALTRQGSRESGVSLLSQATSVWSQAGPSNNRAAYAAHQRLMSDSMINRAMNNSSLSYSGQAEESCDIGSTLPQTQNASNSVQTDQNCQYAIASANANYSYYAGAGNGSHVAYASAYVPPFREVRNINMNMTHLSAVPEMDASGHEASIAMASSNNSSRLEGVLVTHKRDAVLSPRRIDNSTEERWSPIGDDRHHQKTTIEHQYSVLTQSTNNENSDGKIAEQLLNNAVGNSLESGHNSPRSQVSHYDNNGLTSSLQKNYDKDDEYLQERLEIANAHANIYSFGYIPSRSLGSSTPSDQAHSKSTNFNLSEDNPKASSRQNLQHQYAVDQFDDQLDSADIEDRLAALDELDRKIRESVAQLRCVESAGDDMPNEVPVFSKTNESHKNEDNIVAVQGLQAIPFIDESMHQQAQFSDGIASKSLSYIAPIRAPGRLVLPDLVRPPTATDGTTNTLEPSFDSKLKSRSVDHLSSSISFSLAPMTAPGDAAGPPNEL